jgi:hypothetical protein
VTPFPGAAAALLVLIAVPAAVSFVPCPGSGSDLRRERAIGFYRWAVLVVLTASTSRASSTSRRRSSTGRRRPPGCTPRPSPRQGLPPLPP